MFARWWWPAVSGSARIGCHMAFDKTEFSRFLLESGVLMFGEFTLKSGRVSPHFFNSGRLDNGRELNRVGEFMAQRLIELGGADIIYGPAYKGIPLAVAVAGALDRLTGSETGVCFDRKERKDHADGGLFVGRTPKQGERVVVVDDVISSGMSLKEAADKLRDNFGVTPSCALVCVDRQERGQQSDHSAARELEDLKGVRLEALVRLDEVVDLMHGETVHDEVVIDDARRAAVGAYLKEYGVV